MKPARPEGCDFVLATAPAALPLVIENWRIAPSAFRHALEPRQCHVNLLAEGQDHVANRFAGIGGFKGAARYDGSAWSTGRSGASILDDALLSIDCVLENEIRKFSHAIFIGRAVCVQARAGHALLYSEGAYRALQPRSGRIETADSKQE